MRSLVWRRLTALPSGLARLAKVEAEQVDVAGVEAVARVGDHPVEGGLQPGGLGELPVEGGQAGQQRVLLLVPAEGQTVQEAAVGAVPGQLGGHRGPLGLEPGLLGGEAAAVGLIPHGWWDAGQAAEQRRVGGQQP